MAHYAYLRVSTQHQIDKNGLKAQHDAVRDWCLKNDVPFPSVKVFEDVGVSGSLPVSDREGLSACFHLLQKDDVLIVPSLCRLSRDLMTSLLIEKELQKKKVQLVSSKDEGTDDFEDSSKTLLRRMLAIINEHERNQAIQRTKASMRARKERNLSCGKIPFGFSVDEEKKLFQNPREAEIMFAVDQFRAENVKWRLIVESLNRSGCRNRKGTEWSISNLYQIHKRWDGEYRKRFLEMGESK